MNDNLVKSEKNKKENQKKKQNLKIRKKRKQNVRFRQIFIRNFD